MTAMQPLARDLTVDGVRRTLGRLFAQAGIDNPSLDARIIVEHALGIDHAGLLAQAPRVLSDWERDAVAAFAQRRLDGEPVARLLGQKEFWSLPFALSPDTLVPRPETETVVEGVLDMLRAMPIGDRAPRIADLGTGTGAILLSILHERRDASGVGTDISTGAAKTACDNARQLRLDARACFVVCDLADALCGGFDIVVSNPPYIASGDIETLARDVRNFDPRRALDGGPDGLAFYRRIASEAERLLAPGGALVVELGSVQLAPVGAIMAQAGLVPAQPAGTDLAGIARSLILRRRQELGA